MTQPATLAEQSLTLRIQAEQIAAHVIPVPGRPPLERDADTIQLLLAALAEGNYRQTACRVAGISPQTLWNATKRAEAGEPAAILLMEAIEKAEAIAESETVRNIRNASKLPQFWAAGMTLLERKSPDRWGRRQDDSSTPKVIVQIGASGSDVTVNIGGESAISPTSLVSAIDATTTDGGDNLTERALSDADTGRRKVIAPSVPTPTRSRRANRRGDPAAEAEAPPPSQGGLRQRATGAANKKKTTALNGDVSVGE